MRETASPLTSQTTPDIPVSDDKDTDNSGLSKCYLDEWDNRSRRQILLLINIGWADMEFLFALPPDRYYSKNIFSKSCLFPN